MSKKLRWETLQGTKKPFQWVHYEAPSSKRSFEMEVSSPYEQKTKKLKFSNDESPESLESLEMEKKDKRSKKLANKEKKMIYLKAVIK